MILKRWSDLAIEGFGKSEILSKKEWWIFSQMREEIDTTEGISFLPKQDITAVTLKEVLRHSIGF